MSRNLGCTDCHVCHGEVALEEVARPITREEAGRYFDEFTTGVNAGLKVAKASCSACGSKYLAWVEQRRYKQDTGSYFSGDTQYYAGTHFDLSYRSSFNDEPGEGDVTEKGKELERRQRVDRVASQLAAVASLLKLALDNLSRKEEFSKWDTIPDKAFGEEVRVRFDEILSEKGSALVSELDEYSLWYCIESAAGKIRSENNK